MERRTGARNPLTQRELQILAAAAEGCSNRMIGERFGISEQTVKNHVAKILQRLDVPDRTAAVVMSLRQGWLNLADIEVQHSAARRAA